MKIITKHPAFLAVHGFLLVGAVFMMFPFLWMISTSFKSEGEILSGSKDIVLLPDSVRPGFLNSPEDLERITNRKKREMQYNEAKARGEIEPAIPVGESWRNPLVHLTTTERPGMLNPLADIF